MLVQVNAPTKLPVADQVVWVDPNEVMAISAPYGLPNEVKVRRCVLRGGYSIYVEDTAENMEKLLSQNHRT